MWEALGDFKEAFARGNKIACDCTDTNYGEWNNVQNLVLCELTRTATKNEETQSVEKRLLAETDGEKKVLKATDSQNIACESGDGEKC